MEERDIVFLGKINLKVLLGYIPTSSGILSFSATHLQVLPFETYVHSSCAIRRYKSCWIEISPISKFISVNIKIIGLLEE